MTLQEQIDVMTAFRDGAEIECHSGMMLMSDPTQEQWVLTANPRWNWENRKYRIKEAPKTVTLEWWRFDNGEVKVFDKAGTGFIEYEGKPPVKIKTETMEVEG